MVARKSPRVKKSTVVYQSPEQVPRASKNVTTKPIPPKRSYNRDIELQMECVDDELSPAQLKAIKEAQKEHEKANDLIKEVRAGNILVPSSQPNTFTIVPPKPPPPPPLPPTPQLQTMAVKVPPPQQDVGSQRGLPPPRPAQFLSKQLQEMNKTPGSRSTPDVILISDTPAMSASSKTTPAAMPVSQMAGNPLQLQQVTSLLASQGPGATPQQVYKFVSLPSNMPANIVQNQWALRPLLTVPPQQQSQMTFLTHAPTPGVTQFVGSVPLQQGQMPAARSSVASKYVKLDNQNLAVKRPSPSELSASQPVTKKRNPKVAEVNDQAGNWVPLDEYYYGTHDGDASYTEEKGEYRFKCWYCSKMLYNNVRAMQHIQGHIDASKQQNIDLSDLTQCKHCYKQFDTPFEMQTHVEKVHLSNKVLMCRICEKDFSTPRELTVHMKGHHHACEMPYVCHLCNFRSSMYSDVVDHFKKKHDSSHYMLCLYCLRTFEVKFVSQGWGQTQTYYGHLLKHQTKSATKKCVVCRLTFFNALDVKNHRKNCHMGHFKDVKALSSGGKADIGQRQKKGSNLKSLNAPSVSRIQDYGEIIFPAEASNTKCVECKMMMSSTDHYKKYVHCSMCRFATSCSVAYANHMMGFHSGQMSSLNLNIPWERPMREVMYCACGFNSKYGNKIANHLVYCAKWTCYSTKRTQSDTTPGRTGDEKKEGSILGMLGLVQKSTVATKIRSKPKLGTKSGIKVEGIEVKANKKYPGDLKSERKPVTEERSEKLDEKEPKEIIDIENEPVRETARPKKQNERPKEIIDIENEPVRETTRPEKQDERPTDIAYKSNLYLLDKSDKVAEDGEKEKLEQKTDITETDKRDATSENLENKDGKELVCPEVVSEPAKPSEDEQPETDTKTEQDKSSSEAENEQEVTKDTEEIMDTETVDEPDETTEDSQTEMDAETTKSEDKIKPAEIDDNTSIKDEAVDTDTKETHTQGNLKPEHSKDDSEDVRDSESLNEILEDKEIVHEMDTLDEAAESTKANLEKDEDSLKEASDVKQFEPGETGLDSELEGTAETIESIENEKELLEPTTKNTEESEEPLMEIDEKSDDQTSQENEPTEQSKEKQDLSDSSENKKDEPKEDKKPEEDIEPKEEEKPKETERSSQKESSDHGDSRRSAERKSSSDHRDSTDRCSQERRTSSDHRDSSDRGSQESRTSSDHRDSSERHSRDRYDSGDRHQSGSSDRSRHDDRSRQDDRHRQDNRSYGSNRSDNYHGNRSSYDQNRDRDRSYDRDRDRDRDRDYNRNRDYRHEDNRSGHGYQDNRGQSYGSGGQGYRGSQGQYGGYQGNRGDHYQDRNRGGHHQDRNYNRNYQNRGGYNQNYRGGYRGGYY